MTRRAVTAEQLGGGQADATLFTDTMLPPDQPFLVGNSWQFVWEPNTAQGNSGTQMAACFNRVAAGLQVTNASGGGTVPKGFALPRPLSWLKVQGKNQFAEYTFISDTSVAGNVTRMGPMVLCNPNQGACYYLDLVVETGPFQLNIERWTLGAGAVLASASPNAFAANDVLALSAEIIAGTVQLRVWRNNVNTFSFLDNGGSQFTSGMPGFHIDGISAGINQVFRNFRAGVLGRR